MTAVHDQQARDTVRTQLSEVLFVEAGAGTGKTTALVARIVHLLATGQLAGMSQLAAITFTENAAGELRNRLRHALRGDPDGRHGRIEYDQTERLRLERAASTLDDAVLTTVHGFAARILSAAPLEAGLPPGFTVADTAGGGDAVEQSWTDFVDNLLADPAVREHLLAALTLGFTLEGLRTVATELAASWDRLRSRPLTVPPVPPISATAIVALLHSTLVQSQQWPADELAAHLRTTITPLVTELTELTEPLDLLDALNRAQITCSAGKAPDWRQAGLDKPVITSALKAADTARARIVSSVGAAATEALASRVQDFLLAEAQRRRDTGALDYHDLLVLARDVLRGDPEVRRRLHEQWPVLLIDEFQDTDPLQVEIACLLAGNCDESDPGRWDEIEVTGGRLFFVGDAKQSIYRFRRADIDLFNAVSARYSAKPRLEVNFRSVPGVLKAANAAFSELFTPADKIAYSDLLAHRPPAGDTPPVLLLGGPQTRGTAAELRLAESAHLAEIAVRAKREWTIDGGRPASYQDIAILLPTRTSLPALERALQARSVPYRVESRSLVWSTDAVRDLLAVLQALDNPADEVALLAALRHPGLACSDVDLLSWRAAGGSWSLFAPTPPPLTGQHPVAGALTTLKSWHEQRWWLSVNGLIETVVRELRLVELTVSQRRPRDHWRRLRFLIDQARSWCDNGGSGLTGFLRWAGRQLEADADVLETVVPEPDDDAVRILTVHGAKGLQFPITMVAGLATTAGRTSSVLWTDDGPQIRLRAGKLETAGWSPAAAHDKEQSRREATRLLYVAVTRAMDHLVLGCYHTPPTSNGARKCAGQQLWELLSHPGVARIETAPPPDAGQDAPPAPPPPPSVLPDRAAYAQARAALLEAVHRRVATSPTALTVLPAADNATTEPVETGDEPEPAAQRAHVPRSSSRGAAIGTATHRVLELLSDLRHPDVEEVRALARLACAEQQIPELQGDIETRVWSALSAPSLTLALEGGGRPFKEVYLVVRDGERFLEGYIDLLIDAGPAGLTILDYKTDRATSQAQIAAKQEQYAPQLAAYQQAVQQVTAGRPTSTGLVFARPGGPTPGEVTGAGP